jgi:pyridoxamine 5'-phosphate oxidase
MDPDRLAALRRQYGRPPLLAGDVDPDPVVTFGRWFADAVEAADQGLLVEPNAMVLATASPEGGPSARTVLLKAFDARGFVFYTNYTSAKARDLESDPRAELVFVWHPFDRQVRIAGRAERVSAEDTATYFRSRPWASRIGAWVSHQSAVIDDRSALEARFAELAGRWPEGSEVPVPDFWGGVRIVPVTIEFWQGRADRLHDRLRFRRDGDDWTIERLAP